MELILKKINNKLLKSINSIELLKLKSIILKKKDNIKVSLRNWISQLIKVEKYK